MRLPALFALLAACAAPAPPETLAVPVAPSTSKAPEIAPEPATEVAPPPVKTAPLATAFRATLVGATAGSYEPDAALFRQGNERELAGDATSARKTYYELIKNFPSSALVPYAYLAFADLFFEEAEKDPAKWQLAKQAYAEVLKYPPPKNEAYAYARHRLGLVDAQLADGPRALSDQRAALTAVLTYTSLPLAAETAEAARRALVEAYATAAQPEQAFNFFKSTDRAGASALVVALGDEYARRGAGREAAALYDNVLAQAASADICAGAASAARATSDPFAAQIERARKAHCP